MTQEQLQVQWSVFWWALSSGLLGLGIAWKKGFFQRLHPQASSLIRGKDVLRGFGYFLVIQFLVVPFLVGLFIALKIFLHPQQGGFNPKINGCIFLLMVLMSFVGVMGAYFQVSPSQRHRLWQQESGAWYRQMGIGLATWFFGFPLALAINQLISLFLWHFFHYPFTEQATVENLRLIQEDPFLFNLIGLLIVTLVPLTEELLFRGFFQQWLKQKFRSSYPAILLSSLLFSFFHYSEKQGTGNIGILFSLFFLSCLLGYLYERQRSLWPCVALHGFFNLMTFLFLIFK